MTTKLELFKAQIENALAIGDFNAIYNLFCSNNFSLTELKIFYRRNKQVLKIAEFWTSQLPHFYLEGILGSDLKVIFLQSYLAASENCSHELNQHFIIHDKGQYVKHLKLWKAFEYTSFFDSFKQISKNDSELERVVKELEIILKAQREISLEEKNDQNYFLQFSLGEVMLGLSLYYYAFKQDRQTAGNKSWQTQIEVALVEEINKILALFRNKKNMIFGFASNDELQKSFQQNEPPHHMLDKKGLNMPLEPKFKLLYQLFERLISRNSRKGRITLYLCGYADFSSVILNPAPIRTNNNYRIFKFNNAKSAPEEYYFLGIRMSTLSNVKSSAKTDITASVKALDFYGIPTTIENNRTRVEMHKVLQLLKFLSVHKGPVERTFISPEEYVIMNQGDEKFIQHFGSNEAITLFDLEKLSAGIEKYFNWTADEVKATLSYLSFDILGNEFPANWLSRPFLKCKNQILWLGSFLKDRRWDNILLNKIKTEKEHEKLIKLISRNFELKIQALFESRSFKTISGVEFHSANGQKGDFDVLAYKDNYLFVCEAKVGKRSDDFFHAANAETVKLEGHAAEQLEKAIDNIREDWANLKRKLGVGQDIDLAGVTIVPLIITDYFEGDLQLYKCGIRKTSLLELEIIIKNAKKDLLEMYLFFKGIRDSNNPNLKQQHSFNNKWDLWGGKTKLDAEIIIQNIEQNAIWKDMNAVWKFEDEEDTL